MISPEGSLRDFHDFAVADRQDARAAFFAGQQRHLAEAGAAFEGRDARLLTAQEDADRRLAGDEHEHGRAIGLFADDRLAASVMLRGGMLDDHGQIFGAHPL